MDRIWLSDASDTPPSPPENPSRGYPSDGSLSESRMPTAPGAWWFHMVTEELINFLLAADIEPDPTRTDQLANVLTGLEGRVGEIAAGAVSSGFISRSEWEQTLSELITEYGGTVPTDEEQTTP